MANFHNSLRFRQWHPRDVQVQDSSNYFIVEHQQIFMFIWNQLTNGVLTYFLKTHKSTYIFCGRHSFLRSADYGQTMEWIFELRLVWFFSLMISLRLFLDISFGRSKHEKEVFKNITVLSWQCFFKNVNFVDFGATYLLFS